MNKFIEQNLEKVTFELTPNYEIFTGCLNKMSFLKGSIFSFKANTETNLFYYSYSVKKLRKRVFVCNQTDKNLAKNLTITLADQLQKFSQYTLDGNDQSQKSIAKFLEFSQKLQKKLIERLSQ